MIYFIIWYLVGLVSYIVFSRIMEGKLTRGDFIISFFAAIIGPFILLCIIIAICIYSLDSDWGKKKLF